MVSGGFEEPSHLKFTPGKVAVIPNVFFRKGKF